MDRFTGWIEKQSSRGRLLEHLESFGTKIMLRGPIVYQLCKQRTRETTILDEFCILLLCHISFLPSPSFSFFITWVPCVQGSAYMYAHWFMSPTSFKPRRIFFADCTLT